MDESEVPIDVHTNKLLDWLISRRHTPRDWSQKVIAIREKINEAIKDMPEDKEVTDLLSGSYINYYHCQKLIEVLKKTEASSKNLFGQYNSKRMKDWFEILKMYEKENIYLGEVASLLQRNVNYEVPALKKQITKANSLVNDYDRKESSYEKSAESVKKDFAVICKSLGIKGEKIKEELLKKAAEFPEMCEEIVKQSVFLKPAIIFYAKIQESVMGSKKPPLEMLQYIIDNGNSTVYEWKYNTVPSSVEVINFNETEEKNSVEESNEIDFDIDANNDVILVGEDITLENEDVIDYGIELDVTGKEHIDWGISTEDSEVGGTVDDKTVAKGEEAYTILGHPETRNAFLNDIVELDAFLKVRLHEMKNSVDDICITMLPESFQMYDIKTVEEMLHKVQIVLNSLMNPVSLHYLNILTSKKYIDQLVDKLKQKLSIQEKMLASRDFVRVQKEEAIKEGKSLKPKLDLLIQRSKELQELIQQDISKRYKGRPVNLIAGANLL